jgi:hypothetical protein
MTRHGRTQVSGDYDEFMPSHRRELGDFVEDVQSVLANLCGKKISQTLSLKYPATDFNLEKENPTDSIL